MHGRLDNRKTSIKMLKLDHWTSQWVTLSSIRSILSNVKLVKKEK